MEPITAAALLGVIAAFTAAATYVHFRGAVRLKFARQLTDHSTFVAPYNVLVYAASAVANRPIVDRREFAELDLLREHWQLIRDEGVSLLEGGGLRAADGDNDLAFQTFYRRGWRRFYLKWYGRWLPSAAAACPRSIELLQQLPRVHAAMFALLPAGSKLGRHRDPFAGSLRYHLGLRTPNRDSCRIWVDGVEHSWRDGEDLLFDETFVHWARNDSDEDRLILFCDVERPLRWAWMRVLNRWVIRLLLPMTRTRNERGEPVGLLNRVFGLFCLVRRPFQALKKRNKALYYRLKYGLLLGLAVLLVLSLL